jgi:GTP-binding protein
MVDLASYRDLREQIDTLKAEVSAFSDKLGSSKYAIALTRTDAVSQDELSDLVNSFFEIVGVKASKNSELGFDEKIPYFIQDNADETLGYDREIPYFVTAISSATNKNIEPLKHALFNLVQTNRLYSK